MDDVIDFTKHKAKRELIEEMRKLLELVEPGFLDGVSSSELRVIVFDESTETADDRSS